MRGERAAVRGHDRSAAGGGEPALGRRYHVHPTSGGLLVPGRGVGRFSRSSLDSKSIEQVGHMIRKAGPAEVPERSAGRPSSGALKPILAEPFKSTRHARPPKR
jgi:hypothetical protein